MKILVTGATGFVGSWIVRKLIAEGHAVHILRRQNSDLSELNGLEVTYHIGDVTDIDSFVDAAKGAEALFHLAGVVGYSRSMREVMDFVNIEGTKNAIEVCKKHSIPSLVYMSSVVAIGSSFDGKEPLTEESEYNIHHLNLGYFETKHIAENLVIEAHKKNEINAIVLNPSTIYGPGDAKKGSRKTQIKVAQGAMPFYTSGGVNVINVKDMVEATYNAFKMDKSGERFILAGENITIKKLFELIAEAAGVKAPSIYLPNTVLHSIGKIGDLLENIGKKGPINSENAWTASLFHWFDSSKAQKQLSLNVTPAKESIASSVNWMKENKLI